MDTETIRKRYAELVVALINAKLEMTHVPVHIFEDGSSLSSYELQCPAGSISLWGDACRVISTPLYGKRTGTKFPYSEPDWAKESIKFITTD